MQNPYKPASTFGLDFPDWFSDWLDSERKMTREAFEVIARNMDKGPTVVVDGKTRSLSDALERATLPNGVIVMFAGTLQQAYRLRKYDLWVCDGTRGTPDLADKFVRGASDNQGAGDTGGADAHSHGHTHVTDAQDVTVPDNTLGSDGGTGSAAPATAAHDNKITIPAVPTDEDTTSASSLPAYYELIFLMKKKR